MKKSLFLKKIIATVILTGIYFAIYKLAGLEIAICFGFASIIVDIGLIEEKYLIK